MATTEAPTSGTGPRRVVAALAGAVLLGGCSSRLGVPDPGTQQGERVLELWRVLFWSAAGVGVLVVALILWSVLRYRARGGDGGLPKQVEGHLPLEVVYTALPLVLAGVLFGVSQWTSVRTDDLAERPDVTVDVTGFQWQWRFDYRGEDVSVVGQPASVPELVLPVGRTVRLNLRTADVIHSFFVPGFLVKRDLIPGVRNEIDLRPTRPGRYQGHCAEFCGLDHARMNFDVRVVPADEFAAWLDERRGETP